MLRSSVSRIAPPRAPAGSFNADQIRCASSASSGTTSSPRRSQLTGFAVAAVAAGAVTLALGYKSSVSNEPRSVASDTRPSPLWALPSRQQMIQALKESSARSIRPNPARKIEDDESLQSRATDTKSSSPSPAASSSSSDEAKAAEQRKLDSQDGFDLLIIGGGATGTGVAVDAATRGLSVALVERDDFGAGE